MIVEVSLDKDVFIQKNGQGIILYLFQEGRGINLINKVKAYDLQRKGFDKYLPMSFGIPAEMRSYSVVKDVLKDFSIKICSFDNK